MVFKSDCPLCGRRHRFKSRPRVHDAIVCKHCQVRLFVARLNPIELESAGEPKADRDATPRSTEGRDRTQRDGAQRDGVQRDDVRGVQAPV